MAQVFGLSVEELLGMENPDVEMKKAQAIDDMGRLFGQQAADSAQAYLDGTNALLAGGELSYEAQLDFISLADFLFSCPFTLAANSSSLCTRNYTFVVESGLTSCSGR